MLTILTTKGAVILVGGVLVVLWQLSRVLASRDGRRMVVWAVRRAWRGN